MLGNLRNTLAAIGESTDRASGALTEALGDARPLLEELAADVHRTCASVRAAANSHEQAARTVTDVIEAIVWGLAVGLAVYYTRDAYRALSDLVRHG